VNVIVDTSVWSLALRRRRPAPSSLVLELAELIREGRAAMLGPVRQEILTADTDFLHFARVLPIDLHAPRASVSG
jgi:hypothetical protein